MRRLIVSAVFSILGMVAASKAQDIGDVQRGRQLALDVCAACHAVRAGQTQSPLATAPSFEAIAHMPEMTAAALALWLTAQSHHHPTMPNFILAPQQVRNVSAYLLSLRD
jgi:mono/diheme cytochrome c family protein